MARLTYGARKSMPKSDFALPAKKNAGNKAGKGAYPIPNASHARDALSRVSANGTPAEKAEVREKVHKKFPSIGGGGSRADGGGGRGKVPKGEHHQANHREPRSHSEFEKMGDPGKDGYC